MLISAFAASGNLYISIKKTFNTIMKTNKIFLTALFVAFCTHVFSADKFVVAKIILSNNDTIVNLVKYTPLHEMQNQIEIKVNESITNTLYPLDAKSFFTIAGKGDTVRFESNCGLKFGLADKIEKNCYFIMKLKTGTVPLYYFSESKLMTMGTSMQTVQQPAYLSKYRDEWIIMEENNFVNQLIKLIKPFKKQLSPNSLKEINMLEDDLYDKIYQFDDIPRVVDKLNVILK